MPLLKWPRAPIQIVQAYEARRAGRGDTGALIMWATMTVEGLHYLDDLDSLHYGACSPGKDHLPDIINMAHVRWATGSAITALDLCAAAIGRECCGWTGPRELDLRDFDPSLSRSSRIHCRASLSATAKGWVDQVLADPRYKDVLGTRNPLTHSRLRRRLYGGTQQAEFVIPTTGSAMNTRDLVIHARDLATERVIQFLDVVDTFS